MTVYHGSNQTIENPNVSFSKKYLDFGCGFYVTSFEKQAQKWASRKALRLGGDAIVNVYDFDEQNNISKIKRFDDDSSWLEFVCDCRKGGSIYKNYDIIIGNVANDDVFKTVDMYFQGIWDKEQTLSQLKYFKKNDQICLVNQTVLTKVLKFQSSYKVVKLNE